jgi:alanine racemase
LIELAEDAPPGIGDPVVSRRPVRVEIDLDAVEANTRALVELIGPGSGVIAVVKANGYGLGADWIGAAALRGGAEMLAVACADEGVALRLAGYLGPLLVMGYVAPEEADLVVVHGLTVALHRAYVAEALHESAVRLGHDERSVRVHLKVDTGINRFGCSPDEILALARRVRVLDRLEIEGLMTHFANADASDSTYVFEQLRRFHAVRQQLDEAGYRFRYVHAANSAAALHVPEARFDLVRVGIMLSGHSPAPSRENPIRLLKAVRWVSRVARLFRVAQGESVGYGRTWIAERDSFVGLVPAGYADGYPRVLGNRAHALVGGRRCPIIGRVSMDQITVDLTGLSGVQEGDEVVLAGVQDDEEIAIEELARLSDTISYEILTGIAARVPRHYIRGGKVVAKRDLNGHTEQRAFGPEWGR